jgi:lipid-A-disaccharide synthase-like uncharacterized protein
MIFPDEWRSVLYPLGFLSTIPFTARFLLQWIQSEQAKKSVLHPSFWILSFIGNILLMLHSFIQIQFHVCVIQACNALISWRNLNLLQSKEKQLSISTIVLLLIGTALTVCLGFLWQDWYFDSRTDWFRVPRSVENGVSAPAFTWHILGGLAYLLFSSRFWLQWWSAEKGLTHQLSPFFWWTSLIGALLSIIYFFRIDDMVNLIGPLVGMIPYMRNLMFVYRKSSAT